METTVPTEAKPESGTQSAPAATTPDGKLFEFNMPRPSSVAEMRLYYHPAGTLRATVADAYSYPAVKIFQAVPLSAPGEYLSIMTGKGEEILMARRIEDFTTESQETVREEIRRRYLTARVQSIQSIRTEFGITYWSVTTDKGPRDFVIQSMSESCVWLSDTHFLLVDTDGNRFEVVDRDGLDAASVDRLSTVM